MTQALQNLEALVGPLSEAERYILSLQDLVEVPAVRDIPLLLRAIARLARNVPWFALATHRDVENVASNLSEKIESAAGPRPAEHVKKFRGERYLAARGVIGLQQQPLPGPESLRAAFVACALEWSSKSQRRSTALSTLGASIRAITEYSVPRDSTRPLLEILRALGEAITIDEFLEAAQPVRNMPHLAAVWREHFEPTLAGLASRPDLELVPQIEAAQTAPNLDATEPDSLDEFDQELLPLLIAHIHGPAGAEPAVEALADEPIEEVAAPIFVAPVESAGDPLTQRLNRYFTGQRIWSGNYLLLSEHGEVLSFDRLQAVAQNLISLLRESPDASVERGALALLLQLISGRTLKHVTDMTIDDPPAGNGLSINLQRGHLGADVFWRSQPHIPGVARGYFVPTVDIASNFERTTERLRLPIPPLLLGLLRGCRDRLQQVIRSPEPELERCVGDALAVIRRKVNGPLFRGQIRRSFAVHLFDQCRDLALVQLISADTLGHSCAGQHYYAPAMKRVSESYWSLLQRMFDRNEPMPRHFQEDGRVGASSLLRDRAANSLVQQSGVLLNRGVEKLVAERRVADVHHALVDHVLLMIVAIAGHRPVRALLQLRLTDFWLDEQAGAALFNDKRHDVAHAPRLVSLPCSLVAQLRRYVLHVRALAALNPAVSQALHDIESGRVPLFFDLTLSGEIQHMELSSWKARLPPKWQKIPLNWGRTWIRTRGLEMGMSPELAAGQLGHLDGLGYPFSNAGPTTPRAFVKSIAPTLETILRQQGWRVRRGLRPADHDKFQMQLPMLQHWRDRIDAQEHQLKEDRKNWREWQRANRASLKQRALQDVLEHHVIVDHGIDIVYRTRSPGQGKPLPKAQAIRLRDELYASAQEDGALGIARTQALFRVLKSAYKILNIKDDPPPSLQFFRRALDNAFVDESLLAVHQVEALREHVRDLGGTRRIRQETLPAACARVSLVLALFGFLDDPHEIEALLRNRSRYQAPWSLSGTILVDIEDGKRVVGLRNLAAIALAALGKRFSSDQIPTRHELNQELELLLPAWAVPKPVTADLLDLLCQTVHICNRFELSPAARFALDREGSTSAALTEQLALIDGDPVGTIERPVPQKKENDSPRIRNIITRPDLVKTPRQQYLALNKILPTSGADLHLPLTDVRVPAASVQAPKTRDFVIAELNAMLSGQSPEPLSPVIWLLTAWVRRMYVHGTTDAAHPAHTTVKTYLTRIGNVLTQLIWNQDLERLDEIELNEIYLAAIMSSGRNRAQAAAAVVSFHRSSASQTVMPEVDLSEVSAFLSQHEKIVDAQLILPVERTQILRRAWQEYDGFSETAAQGRIQRQAAVNLTFAAATGARKAEVLGLRNSDIWINDNNVQIRVQRNPSRRLKTPAARRLLNFNTKNQPGGDLILSWIQNESYRGPGWLAGRGFLFSDYDDTMRDVRVREQISRNSIDQIREVTGRAKERLHRLRHLRAFECVISRFLSESDHATLSERMKLGPFHADAVLLPRDIQGELVRLGHVDLKVTLASYIHLPWLLRSKEDAQIAERFMTRSQTAFAMGVSLAQIDKLSSSSVPGVAKHQPWLDHVIKPRERIEAPALYNADSDVKRHVWGVTALDRIFEMSTRFRSLQKAVRHAGGTDYDYRDIRREATLFERRIGRRLYYRSASEIEFYRPRQILRRGNASVISKAMIYLEKKVSDDEMFRQQFRALLSNMTVRAGVIEAGADEIELLVKVLQDVCPGLALEKSIDSYGLASVMFAGEDTTMTSQVLRVLCTVGVAERLNARQNS